MDNIDSEMDNWVKSVTPDFLKNWKIQTPFGEQSAVEYFKETTEKRIKQMHDTPEWKRLNLYEDLVTKFPLDGIRKRREAGEKLTFLELVVVHYHYKNAANAVSIIACEREGLSALAKEMLDIAENAKKMSLTIPLDEVKSQIKQVVPYMEKM